MEKRAGDDLARPEDGLELGVRPYVGVVVNPVPLGRRRAADDLTEVRPGSQDREVAVALAEIPKLKTLADRLQVAVDDEETRNRVVEARPIEPAVRGRPRWTR